MATKTTAVLLRAGCVVAQCKTAARGGEVLSYGFERVRGGALLELGRAKVSRAQKYLGDRELMASLETAIVNRGGGPEV